MNAKTNLKIGAAIAALFAATAISHAADAVFESAPVAPSAPFVSAPVNAWEGGYAGISAGYGFSGKAKATQPGYSNSIKTDGFVGSAFGGWNGQSGQFVYGIEGDIGYNGMDGSNAGLTAKNGVDGSLRARLGMAVNDDVLVYATAGGAGGSVKVSDAISSDKNTQWGWTAGVGTDVKVTEQVFGRLEYRYTDLGSKNFDLASGTYDVKSTNHKVLLGVGMKF